jgi:hypothetical protein
MGDVPGNGYGQDVGAAGQQVIRNVAAIHQTV